MRRALILLPLLLVLAGCRTSLFEGLDEDQANRIVAALSHHGINGYKERNADQSWNVSVDDADAVVATELASAYALPRGGHSNLGELFKRQGLISSPEEDRVLFVYGLSQELSETLEKMDGVLLARVHIVLPERDPMDSKQETLPSASVMMRYRSDYNLEPMRDRIRALVAGSVEGLTPARVSLTLLAVTPMLSFPGNCGDGADVPNAAGAVSATPCVSDGISLSSRATTVLGALAAIVLVVAGFMWFWQSEARNWFKRKGREDDVRVEPGTTGEGTPEDKQDGQDAPEPSTAQGAGDEPGPAAATGEKA